jgi:hypothetical protein
MVLFNFAGKKEGPPTSIAVCLAPPYRRDILISGRTRNTPYPILPLPRKPRRLLLYEPIMASPNIRQCNVAIRRFSNQIKSQILYTRRIGQYG